MQINDVSVINDKKYIKMADSEFQERRKQIGTLLDYYNGKHNQQLVKKSDDVIYNVCKQVVDETVSFLLPFMPTIEASDNADILNAIWSESGGATVIQTMATYGSVTGHVFVMVTQNADETISITVMPTQNVIKYTSGQSSDKAIAYEVRWDNERQLIVLEGDTWIIYEYTLKGREWALIQDPIAWKYSIPPMIDWKHLPSIGSVYGLSDIPHYRMNDDINKIASDVNAILRYHASPTTVVTGAGNVGDVVDKAIDNMLFIKSAEAKVYNVEMSSDLKSSQEMLNQMISRFFQQARVVITNGIDNFRGMTTLGVRASYMPMIAKNETLRRQYSEGIRRICKLLLEMRGLNPDVSVSVVWGEALPVDTAEEIRLIQAQIDMGVMELETAATRLGLNFQAEMEAKRKRLENV